MYIIFKSSDEAISFDRFCRKSSKACFKAEVISANKHHSRLSPVTCFRARRCVLRSRNPAWVNAQLC